MNVLANLNSCNPCDDVKTSEDASLTASEIKGIILGQDIDAPSVQRQQIAELEKSTDAQIRSLLFKRREIHSPSYEELTHVQTSSVHDKSIAASLL